MSTSTSRPAPAWLITLQIAVILASVALTLMPARRVAPVVPLFMVASFASCAFAVWTDWKSGRLSMTPRQLLERAKGGEKIPRQYLAVAAAIASCIGLWHISMG
jgi:hypothetical protein